MTREFPLLDLILFDGLCLTRRSTMYCGAQSVMALMRDYGQVVPSPSHTTPNYQLVPAQPDTSWYRNQLGHGWCNSYPPQVWFEKLFKCKNIFKALNWLVTKRVRVGLFGGYESILHWVWAGIGWVRLGWLQAIGLHGYDLTISLENDCGLWWNDNVT